MKIWLRGLVILMTLGIVACNDTKPVPPAPPGPAPVVEYATGLKAPALKEFGVLYWDAARKLGATPENFDWSDQGYVTPVRDQGNCGSCWAFASTQTIEMAYLIFAHKTIDFSEQELVGNLYYGCGGGYGAGEYQVNKGQTDEASCKYTATNKKCTGVKPVGKGTSWGYVGTAGKRPTVAQVQTAIQAYGAVWVTVCANSAFMNYRGGLSPVGPACRTNHMVALTGWKTVNGKVYFHMKNSWGLGWGEAGYGWFTLGSYNMGEDAGYIAVDSLPCPPPKLKLPSEMIVVAGDEIVIALKKVDGVSYAWFQGSTQVGEGNELVVTPSTDTVYRAAIKNSCGAGEIQVKVTIKKTEE